MTLSCSGTFATASVVGAAVPTRMAEVVAARAFFWGGGVVLLHLLTICERGKSYVVSGYVHVFYYLWKKTSAFEFQLVAKRTYEYH